MKPKLKRKKYYVAGEVLYDDPQGGTAPRIGSATSSSSTTNIPNTINNAPENIGSAVPSMGMDAAYSAVPALVGTAVNAIPNQKNTHSLWGNMVNRGKTGANIGTGVGTVIGGIAGSAAGGVGAAPGAAIGAVVGGVEGAVVGGIEGGTEWLFKHKGWKEADERAKQEYIDQQNLQKQFLDPTTGTIQSNPVYGMEDGGSIYDLGHMKHGGHMHKKHLSHHESGIVHSSHNGVDKTKASMPEGAFVIPANKREQAIKDGILENKPMSPNQGGVPIMISGGDVDNPEREGVIMPGRVKQLLAMGVDLDKYAPNADHSLYDIAGTRKNVEHGGLMHYAGGNTVLKNKIKYDPNQYINNIDTEAGKDYKLNVLKDLQEEPQNEYQWSPPGQHNYYEKSLNPTASQQPVWDPVAKHYFMENTTDQNLANLASKYPNDPSFNLDAWNAAGGLGGKPKPIDPFTVEKKNTKQSTPWTEEQKALGIETGLAGLNLGVQGAEALWNLSREYTPLPKPTRFISEAYTPNISAADALQKQQMDIARATGLYNAREAGMTPNLLTAMHANELASGNQYNAQRQGILENARLQNLQQANQDRANYQQALYANQLANAEKLQEFRGAKAAAVGQNISEGMKATEKLGLAGKEYLYDTADTRYQQHQNANSLAYQLNARTVDQADYRKNKDSYDQALKTLSSLKAKNPTKYAELAPAIATMSWPDAVNYLSTRI